MRSPSLSGRGTTFSLSHSCAALPGPSWPRAGEWDVPAPVGTGQEAAETERGQQEPLHRPSQPCCQAVTVRWGRRDRLRTEPFPTLTVRLDTASLCPRQGGSSAAGWAWLLSCHGEPWINHILAFCLSPLFVKWTQILHKGVVKPN